MAENLLARFKQKIQSLQLIPSSGGCFEVSLNGELVYSKLKTGDFPDEQEIVKQVESRL